MTGVCIDLTSGTSGTEGGAAVLGEAAHDAATAGGLTFLAFAVVHLK